MNKKLLALLIAVFPIAAMAGTSVPNADTNVFEGRIVWKKDDGSKVTLKKSPSDETSTAFLVSGGTKVTIGGEAKTGADLKSGWKAKVTPKAGSPGEADSIEVSR
jgi:hypothetical protein